MLFWQRKKIRKLSQVSNSQIAKAKINLSLHVTGQRADGYHLLDSLVVFADFGDQLTFQTADDFKLNIAGPFGAGLSTSNDNLISKAAQLLDTGRGASISLEKNLPVSSGIGGGSADAAASLRGLAMLWDVDLPDDNGLSLGADVPVCLTSKPQRMQGIGDQLTPLKCLPPLNAVLVNCGVSVSTPAIFKGLQSKQNAPIGDLPETVLSYVDAIKLLADHRNDLQDVACTLQPEIQTTLDAIAGAGADLTRMSGSGATCFGLFSGQKSASDAAEKLGSGNPSWWVQQVTLF